MPPKKMSDPWVKSVEPIPGKQIAYFDTVTPGLVLVVSYGGTKTWRVLHYVNGKPKTEKLGRYRAMKLSEAREAVRKFQQDPKAALAQNEPEVKPETFKEVAEEFIRRHVVENKLRSEYEIRRCLKRYIYPAWQDRPFLEIRRRAISDLLNQIQDQNGERQANMVLAIISKLMRWYQASNDDYISPVVPGMKRGNAADRKRKRILKGSKIDEINEIRAVWNACEGTFGDIVKLLLLTGQRKTKVGEMRWADIVDGEWRIPSEDREKSTAGSLKLPQAALDIINARPRIAGNPFVFPSGKRSKLGGKGPFNSYSQRKVELDKRLPEDMPDWTLHDLRRTARSLMAKAGVRPDVAERVLGHAIPGVEGVYDRYDYEDEKADALNKLAALIDRIVNPSAEGNVVAMESARSGAQSA